MNLINVVNKTSGGIGASNRPRSSLYRPYHIRSICWIYDSNLKRAWQRPSSKFGLGVHPWVTQLFANICLAAIAIVLDVLSIRSSPLLLIYLCLSASFAFGPQVGLVRTLLHAIWAGACQLPALFNKDPN
ncbi:hypothetical protein C8Q70DRAFT_95842 [Cubamyces menziesii]|nr:hypothetical protein C8Q70DRAFT_95842 [Cubamyces menziesii]